MDDLLTRHFDLLDADVIRTVRLAPAEHVRAHGDRRRHWWTTRAFAAAVAVLAATGLTAGGVALSVGGRPDPWVAFPAEFTMPHDGEWGWGRNNELTTESPFNPCNEADVTLANRLDARTMIGSAFPDDPNPIMLTEQLLLYPDEATAQAVMTKLRAWAVRDPQSGCGWIGGVYRGPHDFGPDVLWSSAQPDGGGWRDALMARFGRTIFILHAAGGPGVTPYNEDLASVQLIRERLCETMRICVAYGSGVNGSVTPNDPAPAPSWWDFLQTPHPQASPPYDPWEYLNPNPYPTPT